MLVSNQLDHWFKNLSKKPTVINVINCTVTLHVVMSMPFTDLSDSSITAVVPEQPASSGFMYRHLQKEASRNVKVF